MASAELETKTEGEPSADLVSTPKIAWDPSVEAAPLGHGWDAEPVVLDWFGDGEADLVVTAGGGTAGRVARLYRPSSSRRWPPMYDAGLRLEALDGLRCISPLPNGSPSRFDLVALDLNGLVFLPNQGDARRPEFGPRQSLDIAVDLGLGPCRIVQLFPADWDGDGLTDLLAGIDDLTGYWPDGDRLPIAQQVGFNQKGGHPGYDRNGLWRGQAPRGRFFWLRNIGRPGAPRFELQPEIEGDAGPLELGLRPAPLMITWGSAGSLELLTTDDTSLVRIYRNFGGQCPPVLLEPRTLQCGHGALHLTDDRTTVVAADIDGDRQTELVYGTADGRIFAVRAGATRNDAKTPVAVVHERPALWLGGHAVVAAADLDADGDVDLIVGDALGRLHFFHNLGAGAEHRFAAPVALEAGGLPFRLDPGPDGMRDGPAAPRLGFACPALVNWTGHGRLDLIIGGAGGEVIVLRNDGALDSPRFGAPSPLRCQGSPLITPPRVRPAAADWNEPGSPELIALDLQGFLCVYPRVGTHEVGPPVPLVDRLGRFLRLDGNFGQAGRCSLWAGPWCGSGKPDILVGLPRGNRHVIAALCGEPLHDVARIPTVLLLENLGHGRLAPRPVFHADGRPLVVGTEGCSPCGVNASARRPLDLLVGSDEGTLTLLRREDLKW